MKVDVVDGRERIQLKADSDPLVRVAESYTNWRGLWLGTNLLDGHDVRELRLRLEQWENENTLRLPSDG